MPCFFFVEKEWKLCALTNGEADENMSTFMSIKGIGWDAGPVRRNATLSEWHETSCVGVCCISCELCRLEVKKIKYKREYKIFFFRELRKQRLWH